MYFLLNANMWKTWNDEHNKDYRIVVSMAVCRGLKDWLGYLDILFFV